MTSWLPLVFSCLVVVQGRGSAEPTREPSPEASGRVGGRASLGSSGGGEVRDESIPTLDAAVKVLEKYPSIHVEVSGHTDDIGSREHNLRLSVDRADAVRDYLIDHGIDLTRIATRGAGPDEPIASNDDEKGQAKNRRIEFHIIRQ